MKPRNDQAKCLVLDIETRPILAYVWGLKDQNIALSQIKEDWSVLAWSAKWLGEKKIFYADTSHSRDISQDKAILKSLWHLLNKADIVITQYGTGFDGPRLNSRFMLQGMKPPSPYKHYDTYRLAKRVGQFTSNKLEYLTDKFCVKYKKLKHQKFPGMVLWTECLKGNPKAWAEMKKYNIHDVLSTEELYNKLKAWAPESMPKVYNNGSCDSCGEFSLQKRGFHRKYKWLYQRLHCQNCGRWSMGDKQ